MKVSDTTDNGFVALWSALQGDKDYLKPLNDIYDHHGAGSCKHFSLSSNLRKFAVLQSSDAFVENMFTKNFNKRYIDETICDEPELRKKYEDFRNIFTYLTLSYINSNSKTDSERQHSFRKYLSLPEKIVGAYGGYQSSEVLLSFLEEVLQIKIFILNIGSLDEGDDPAVIKNKYIGRLYHINEHENSAFESSLYERILFPSDDS